MDQGKELIFEERRKIRSKEVKIQFVTPDDFNVVDEDGNLKYVGKLNPLECTCMSYYQHSQERYTSTHAEPFLCKHLIKANEVRGI